MQNKIFIDAKNALKKNLEYMARLPGDTSPDDVLAKRGESLVNSIVKLLESLGISVEFNGKRQMVATDLPHSKDKTKAGYYFGESLFQIATLAVALGYYRERYIRPNSGAEISGPIPCIAEEFFNAIADAFENKKQLTREDICRIFA